MPTTFTPHLHLAKIGRGDVNWDALVNANWDVLDNISQGVVSFGTLASGTNTAALVVGSGGSLNFSGSGVVNANQLRGTPVFNQSPLPGQILIFDEATGNYVPGDPIVSGPDEPGTAPTRPPVQIGGFDGANVQRIATDSTGNVSIILAGIAGGVSVPIGGTVQAARQDNTSNGTITSTEEVEAGTYGGYTTVNIAIYGTWTGTLAIEGQTSSGSFTPVPAVVVATGALYDLVSNAVVWVSCAGYSAIRIRGNTVSSGAANIDMNATFAPAGSVNVTNFPTTQAVTGPLTDVQLRASAVSVSVNNFPTTQTVTGTVAVTQSGTWTVASNADTTIGGTSAPSKLLLIGGKTSDGTPQYRPLPLTAGGAAVKIDGSAITQPVSGSVSISNFPATQPISAISLPLPTGAATSAKQPALGTAGSASADVITVQGIASMTALKVDGSAVTQPVSGSVTVSGTVAVSNSFALDATLTSGAQKSQLYDGTNVIGTAAHPVQVSLANTAANATAIKVDGSAVTQPVSGTVTISNSFALDTSVTGLQVSQASTTSGQKGNLIQGAVTTAAPTYTTGQTNPLSLTTSGALRVDGSGTTQPVSGTVSINAIPTGSNTIGNVGLVAGSAVIGHVIVDSGSITASGTVSVSNSFTLDATAAKLNLAQASTTSGQTGPLIQGAVTTSAPTYTTAQTNPLSLTTAGALRVDGSGVTQPVSGTVSINAIPAGSNLIGKVGIDQTTPGTTNKVSIGTDGTIAINAALPTGSNVIGHVINDASSAIIGKVGIDQTTPGTTNKVSIGTDGTVAINAAIPTGSNVIGGVTQSGTWTVAQGTAAASTAGWPTTSGTLAVQSGAWTSGTSVNAAVTLSTTGYNVVLITLNATSTMTGGVLTFEASDDAGTTYYPIQAARVNSANIETTFALSVTTQAWQVNVAGFTNFRVRLSTIITGSGTANVRIQANASSIAPDMTVQGVVATKTALTASSPTQATVGVTSASAVATQATRKGLVLINTSASTISIAFGTAAVLNSGITLNPSGGTFVMDEYTFTTAAVNAIASAASSNLAIQEFLT